MGDRLGGHLVSGHVDCSGTVALIRAESEWRFLHFQVDRRWMRQIVSKGSIAIDGVSLTVVEADDESFNVALIPHTLSVTTLGKLRVGDRVNLETDLLAKYVERQLRFGQ
jgi:riboflavin synthase